MTVLNADGLKQVPRQRETGWLKFGSLLNRAFSARMLRSAAVVLIALAWSNSALCDLLPRREVHHIIYLVRGGKLAEVEALLNSDSSPVSSRDYNNSAWTPLHYAVDDGNRKMAELLIAKGANVNIADSFGHSILGAAKDVEMARLLLENGAVANPSPKDQRQPLMDAIIHGRFDVAELLMDKGADPKAVDKTGRNSLFHVAQVSKDGAVAFAKLLLSKGVDAKARAIDGSTPIHTVYLNPAIVELLLANGLDIGARSDTGTTPLHWAANFQADISVTRVVLAAKPDINAVNDTGETPLHWAATGMPDKIELLLDHGAEINAKDKRGRTPLQLAIGEGKRRLETAEALRRRGGQ
jgi:ankyrin repeat protein